MTDTTAKIRAKGLEATGVTEEIAGQMFSHVGRHYMAIVELEVVEPHGPNTEGKRRVDLVLHQVEPAMDTKLDEHLRQLTRTLHANRTVHSEQGDPTIDGLEDVEPSVEDVIAARKAHDAGLPHLFDSDNNDDGTPRCILCGETENDELHVAALVDPDEDDSDPYSFIHAKGHKADVPGSETPCGLRATFDATLSTHQDDDQVTCPDCLTALHAGQDDDQDEEPAPAESASEPDPDDPAFEPHTFDGRQGYACTVCEQPADSAIHTTADEPVPVA